MPASLWRPTPLLRASAGVHALSLAGAVLFPAQWALAAGAVLASHVVLAAAGMWPRSRWLGPNLSRLPCGMRGVALTFDDGPDPEATPRVLDLLEGAGARATFFCIGQRVEAHSGIAAAIVEGGHRLENHTLTHPNGFALLGPRRLAQEIDRTQEILGELSGRPPRYFRAPAGIRSPWLEPFLARRGLTLTSWSRRGYDAVDPDADRVARRLIAGLAARDILLLHDGSLLSRRPRTPVLEVLPCVLRRVKAAGLETLLLPGESEA